MSQWVEISQFMGKNKRPFTQGQNIIEGRNITFLCGKMDVPLKQDKMSQWLEFSQLVKMTQFMGNWALQYIQRD
jgi:hypothetical protein